MKIFDISWKEIQDYILTNKEICENKKNKYAEVFTPIELVEDILDHFPKHIWENIHFKWLEPAAGIGNFALVIYFRLMKSLNKHIKDKMQRHHHILSNMLYMVELNTSNFHQLQNVFGKNANILKGDFLTTTSFPSSFFNVVITNPPYQTEKKEIYVGSSGNKTLWNKFIVKSMELLHSPDGYLGFITPSGWRRPEHTLLPFLTTQNQLLYLHVFNKKQGLDIFNAQTRFDIYCVQKTPCHKKTKVVDENNKIHSLFLKNTFFIPNGEIPLIQKITTTKKNGLSILYDSSLFNSKKLKEKKTNKYPFPIIHTMTKRGLGIRYSNIKPEKNPKVVLNFNEILYPYNDYLGEYGMSQLSFGIPIKTKEEGEKIIRALNSEEFKKIVKSTKWGSFQTDYRMFTYFKKDFFRFFKETNKKTTSIITQKRKQQKQNKTKKIFHSWN